MRKQNSMGMKSWIGGSDWGVALGLGLWDHRYVSIMLQTWLLALFFPYHLDASFPLFHLWGSGFSSGTCQTLHPVPGGKKECFFFLPSSCRPSTISRVMWKHDLHIVTHVVLASRAAGTLSMHTHTHTHTHTHVCMYQQENLPSLVLNSLWMAQSRSWDNLTRVVVPSVIIELVLAATAILSLGHNIRPAATLLGFDIYYLIAFPQQSSR